MVCVFLCVYKSQYFNVSVCLSIYLSVYLSLSVCLSSYLPMCLSLCFPVCLSACLSASVCCLSACLSNAFSIPDMCKRKYSVLNRKLGTPEATSSAIGLYKMHMIYGVRKCSTYMEDLGSTPETTSAPLGAFTTSKPAWKGLGPC